MQKENFKKYVKFLLAGLPSFIIAIPLNYFLVTVLNLSVSLSYVIVLFFQININFFIVRKYVFSKGNDSLVSQYMKFIIGISMFRVLDWGVYSLFVIYFGVYYLLMQIINVFVFSLLKYFYSKNILQKVRN